VGAFDPAAIMELSRNFDNGVLAERDEGAVQSVSAEHGISTTRAGRDKMIEALMHGSRRHPG